MRIKKILALLFAALMVLSVLPVVSAADKATVVYLKDGNEGSGASPTDSVNKLTAALQALDLSKDCTIVICGKFTQSSTFAYPTEFSGTVTITSNYGGTDYRTQGANYSDAPSQSGGLRFVMPGEFLFKDIDFKLVNNYFLIVANHHPITIDTGVTMASSASGFTGAAVANAFTILGGYQNGQLPLNGGSPAPTSNDLPVNITVKSGTKILVAPYSRQIEGVSYSGKATMNIGGTAQVNKLYLAPVNCTYAPVGNVELNIKDSASISSVFGTNNTGALASLTVNWLSGNIGLYKPGDGEAVLTVLGDGMVLNYSDAASKTATFALVSTFFDVKNKIGDPVTPPVVTEPVAPPVTEAPVSTDEFPVTRTASNVYVDGELKPFEAYMYNENNYFKLRDIAIVLVDKFEVGYDNGAVQITKGGTYTANGTELNIEATGDKTAILTNDAIYIDGALAELACIKVEGSNYFKLRDLGEQLGFDVDYDAATKNIIIEKNAEYTAD